MLKGKKRERSRTFVEIVFFAACWVTGVHDDGDVLIFGEVEEGEKGNESESEIQKKKRLGASDNGKEKKLIVIPCRNLDELVQKLCWFHQPRTATRSHRLGKWENAMAQFDTSLRPSHVQVIALSFSFLNNNTTTTTNNNHHHQQHPDHGRCFGRSRRDWRRCESGQGSLFWRSWRHCSSPDW